MAWSEINLEKQVWTIPRHKTKSDRGHEVQLSDLAMDVLPQCSVRAADCLGWQRTIESSERSLAFRQTNPSRSKSRIGGCTTCAAQRQLAWLD
jgi:hypothetical protein